MSSAKGIENRKIKDARRIYFVCQRCKKSYSISYGKYRRYKDDNPYVPMCRNCKAQTWYSNLSEEEKKHHDNAISESYHNKSDEEKKRLSLLSKQRWESKSDEEKKIHEEISSKNMKNYWANLSPEEFNRRRIVSTQILREFRDNITIEERERISNMLSVSLRNHWKSKSESELDKHRRRTSEIMKYWWANVDDNTLKERSIKLSIKSKEWWKNLTKEKYEEWDKARIIGVREYSKKLDNELTKTERMFMEFLNSNHFMYKIRIHNIYEHPEFSKLFPENPVSRYNSVSPYHQWDFLINISENKNIFVDIDGSIHDKDTNGFYKGNKLAEYINFNDSQRPYQTDGLEAYTVLCYNDDIFDDTLVMNVETNECIIFKDFINYLNSLKNNQINIVAGSTIIDQL